MNKYVRDCNEQRFISEQSRSKFTVNKKKHIYLITNEILWTDPVQCSVVFSSSSVLLESRSAALACGEKRPCSQISTGSILQFSAGSAADTPSSARLINDCVSANTPVHPPSPNYTFIWTTTNHANGGVTSSSSQLGTSRNALHVQSSLVLFYRINIEMVGLYRYIYLICQWFMKPSHIKK